MPGGGRGYVRPASLISVWSSAPYLQNNSVGYFNGDPSVEGRMAAFDDGISQMLWPEQRDQDPRIHPRIGDRFRGPSKILRTTAPAISKCRPAICPATSTRSPASSAIGCTGWRPGCSPKTGDVQIGPIPKGTPVNLLANIKLLSESPRPQRRAAHTAEADRGAAQAQARSQIAAGRTRPTRRPRKVFDQGRSGPLSVSKCPDFIVNKGHYFGSNLSDDDKNALIELLKTF